MLVWVNLYFWVEWTQKFEGNQVAYFKLKQQIFILHTLSFSHLHKWWFLMLSFGQIKEARLKYYKSNPNLVCYSDTSESKPYLFFDKQWENSYSQRSRRSYKSDMGFKNGLLPLTQNASYQTIWFLGELFLKVILL